MNKIRCLLVDDEPPALEVLRTYIATLPVLEIVGECPHAIAAFQFLQHDTADLIFIDVNMPQLSGIDFLKTIPHPPKTIFTTAHREYAVEGFELGAVDYLLKPYSLDRFLKAVYRALNMEQKDTSKEEFRTSSQNRFLYVRANRKMVKIMVDDILYIESLKDYLRIFLANGQVITKQTITAIEAMLPAQEFMRVHRSFIVAEKKISAFDQRSLFIGKTELPVGPLYKHVILKRLSGPKV
jgi:DNA-binding LytR/AlgR family response regulator